MCVLRVLFAAVNINACRYIFRAVGAAYKAAQLGRSHIRKAHGVGSHISNKADGAALAYINAFIKLLCQQHGFFGRKVQFFNGVLLQAAGSVRRQRVALAFFFVCLFNNVGGFFQRRFRFGSFFRVIYFKLLAVKFNNVSIKNRRFVIFAQACRNSPVFLRHKVGNFLFPVADNFYGYGLHAPGAEPFAYFAPQKRA